MNTILKHLKTPLLFVLAVCCVACSGQETEQAPIAALGDNKAEHLDALISSYADYDQFNGTVLVAKEGEVVYKNGFGMANFEWDVPNTSDTKFRLASITKQFTACAVMQLVEAGKLDLETPISAYLPNYPKSSADVINIHHLLTHTSGIPNYTDSGDYQEQMDKRSSVEGLIARFKDLPLDFEPGKQFNYSNSGYVLLGAIIESASGKSYEEVLQEQIFDPLGMTNSGYDHNEEVMQKRASGYYKMGRLLKNANYIDMSTPYSAGALYSTVEDLFLWDQALYTDQLLSDASKELVFSKHVSQGSEFYGYGWDIDVIKAGGISSMEKEVVAHSGFINGFNTRITRFVEDGSTVILLNNTSGAPLYHMTTAIAGILYDQEHIFAQQAVANQTAKLLEQEGIAKAKEYFHEYKHADNCYLDEGEMNMLGYGYLEQGNLEFANFIFELNKTEFHYSANTYDSYAEVQLAMGNRDVAIENYLISIQKNPENQNAIDVLTEMGVDVEEMLEKLKGKE